MVHGPAPRRFRLALSAVLVATLSAAPGMVVAAPSVADPGSANIASPNLRSSLDLAPALATGRSVDLAPALAADGTFLGARTMAGTVDTHAWALVSDLAAGQPPRFARADVAAATPVGPWSGLGSNGACVLR